jgi:uncharacterized repeat protein (TIGR03806 family)
MSPRTIAAVILLLVDAACSAGLHAEELLAPQRVASAPYLDLPGNAGLPMPALLSQTGTFASTARLAPAPGFVPYEVISPLWSDGAVKSRWIAVPYDPARGDDNGQRISFVAQGAWWFPAGTVLVKHFELALDERQPARRRRLETRILVRSDDGRVHGATYRWLDDGSDAELVEQGADEDLAVTGADGAPRQQRWHYPSRSECLVCHSQAAGGVLGIKTSQLNAVTAYPDGRRANQLAEWNRLGLFQEHLGEDVLAALPRLVRPTDSGADLESRVRSYLDANCSHCHRPGAMAFHSYDARFDTPLEQQNLVQGRVINENGIDRARYIRPQDPWRSMVLVRMEREDLMRMPPLGRNVVDREATRLLRAWIASLPGLPVVPPPLVAPAGGTFAGRVAVSASHDDPAAELRYTVDGSIPDDESPVLPPGLTIERTTVLRVRAYKPAHAGSLTITTTYIVQP